MSKDIDFCQSQSVTVSWLINCMISEISRTSKMGGDNSLDATKTPGATHKINSIKLFVSVVYKQ